jgi:hypothetical protein
MSLGDTVSVATSIITRQKGVLSHCTNLYLRLHKRGSGPCDCDIANTLEILKVDLQHYHDAFTNLVRTSSKATQLVRPSGSCLQPKFFC